MTGRSVLHYPGPRPAPFSFPFAEAGAALDAIVDAVAALRAMVSVHEAAVVSARIDFEGVTRVSFDQGFDRLMGETEDGIARLETQADQLEDDIAEARRRREASLDAIADWDHAMRRYLQDAAAQPS